MKYFIWGAGERGKKVFDLLGSDAVVAFIDSNEQKVKSGYINKKVIAPQEISEYLKDEIIVVTPFVYSSEITNYLEEQKIYNYLCLEDCPEEVLTQDKDIFDVYNLSNMSGKIALYGINVFTLILYNYLVFNTQSKPIIICQKNIHHDLTQLLKNEFELETLEEGLQEADRIVLLSEGFENESIIKDGIKIPISRVSDFLVENINFTNEKIRQFKGIHKGKRCFIVATGPSLRMEDLKTLHDHHEICISMNRIYNLFDQTEWRPDYYVIEDAKMIEDLSDEISEIDLPYKFVAANPECYWTREKAHSSIKYQMIVQNYKEKPGFSECFEKYVYNGRTVTYVCLQLAAYMGFSEVYLLGVDFNYSKNLYAEENHFKGYHKSNPNVRLNQIDPERMRLAYEKAKEYGKTHDIRIYNATRGGKLEVFERKDFDKIFN